MCVDVGEQLTDSQDGAPPNRKPVLPPVPKKGKRKSAKERARSESEKERGNQRWPTTHKQVLFLTLAAFCEKVKEREERREHKVMIAFLFFFLSSVGFDEECGESGLRWKDLPVER